MPALYPKASPDATTVEVPADLLTQAVLRSHAVMEDRASYTVDQVRSAVLLMCSQVIEGYLLYPEDAVIDPCNNFTELLS